MLVNNRQVGNVPGRKTDPADASWLARLLRHGLVEASFVPERETRELRDLCRMRTTLLFIIMTTLMGNSVTNALKHFKFEERGKRRASGGGRFVTATIHPSAVLRAPDAEQRHEEYRRFVDDLKGVRNALALKK